MRSKQIASVNTLPSKKHYTESLNIRFSKPEYEWIQEVAEDLEISNSEAVRRIIFSYKVIMETPFYKLIKPIKNVIEEEPGKEAKT
jgi:hypothetical protein